MKNILLFTITLLFLASCRPQKEIIYREVNTETSTTDTVFQPLETFVYLKGETKYITSDSIVFIEVPGEMPLVNIPPLTRKTSLAFAKAQVNNSSLNLLLIQNDTLIKQKFDSLKQIITVLKHSNKTVNQHETKIITKPGKFHVFCVYWFIFSVLSVLIWLYFKFKPFKFL